jgi:hypothetical protein
LPVGLCLPAVIVRAVVLEDEFNVH